MRTMRKEQQRHQLLLLLLLPWIRRQQAMMQLRWQLQPLQTRTASM
jgi:hypothetical protein